MSELANNNTGSEEGSGIDTNQNERGISMDTNNDQQTENNTNEQEKESNMTNTPKTRGPYDGSYAHGVTADSEHVQTITAYNNAEDRLNKRRLYLIGQYEEIRTSYGATDDVGERAKLLKRKSAMESQIKAVNKIRETLSSIKGEIEAAERAAQATVEFMDFNS